MTASIVPPNHHNGTRMQEPTRADRAAERYREASRPRLGLWARTRAYVLAGAAGLAIGVSATLVTVDQLAPLAGARRVTNAIVTTQADGADWFLVAGWAVPVPKAPVEETGR